jgi:uncharacterized protein (DUF302 family)
MSYFFSKTVHQPFDAVLQRTVDALAHEGFGIITRIDLQSTFKAKLGVDFRPYVILGACNPLLAHEALALEDKVGVMLPCNVIVQAMPNGVVEVAAVDPAAAMATIGNPALEAKAEVVADKLQAALALI